MDVWVRLVVCGASCRLHVLYRSSGRLGCSSVGVTVQGSRGAAMLKRLFTLANFSGRVFPRRRPRVR